MTGTIHHRTSRLLGRGSLLLASWALGACAVAGAPHDEAGTAELALTQQERVFGFEDVADWTASSGIRESSTLHTEGAAALGLRGFTYAELTSPALSTLSGVTDELALDIRLPASPAWGQVQVLVSSPTLGLNRAWLGQASLQGLPAGTWSTLAFAVPASIKSALQQSTSDLRITLTLNAPSSSAATVVDHLRFEGGAPAPACGDGSPYTLDVTTVPGFDDEILEDMICTFHSVYPQLVQRFNPAAPTTVGLIITEDPGVAWASNGNTYYNKQHMLDNPLDTDAVVHEIMHIVQSYSGPVPGWIVEGIADYVRDAYGLQNAAAGWSIPSGWTYGAHYLFGYGDAAAFFKWIDATYRASQTPVADELDDILRAGTYSSQTWVDLTGYDVETLWQQYSNNQAPLPATSGIAVYENPGFGGRAVVLDRGQYDASDLGARAIGNDWISSIQVPPGYTVTVYYDSPFSGTSIQYTADAATLGAMNDQISSIVVE
ncbi:basic secretory protein-like protein [Sorangium sp. So ce1036]|uniref:basic secretory protein-like protein n=1 Tax=Sorangium sp. So ce1036 TaxID=3133328 RepID=UPI003F1019D8